MEFNELITLSIVLFGVVEFLKTPFLKPMQQRLSLSNAQYEVMIHLVVGALGAFVVFSEPSQWNALVWQGIYGYPVWAGNLVSVVLIGLGDKMAHGVWDWFQEYAYFFNREQSVG